MQATPKEISEYSADMFFELSPDLLCIAGFDGYFKRINRAVSTKLGYTLDELYARPINDFVYHEDQEITAKVRGELHKSKPLHHFENRYLTKSGEIIWLSWTSLPVESNRLVFAIAKDITHIKKLEAERNALLATLSSANKDLKNFTYTTSHDIRSPVGNLVMLLNMVKTDKIEDPETNTLIEYLKLAGEQLKKTLHNYVDVLSEIHREKVSLEEVCFQTCLDTVLSSIDSLVKNSQVTIRADFSELGKVRFKRNFLESIFLNFITNSIKYARPDRYPEMHIRSTTAKGLPQLVVSDNGLGFDLEKVKDKLFGLHQKFHDHPDSKGIGLYLIYSHITSLGGQITVDSAPNQGTTFTITFQD